MKRLVLVCGITVVFLCPAFAQGGRSPRRNPPSIQLDEDKTPLQRNIEEQVQARITKEKNITPKCADTINNPDPDPDVQAKNVAKFCKVPRIKEKKTKVVSDLQDPSCKQAPCKVVGRKIETETELVFDDPEQQGTGFDRWADLKVSRGVADEIAGVAPGENPSSVRVRSAVLPTSAAINNDRDCIDTLTRQHRGGYRMQGGIPVAIPDGDPESCFDTASPPALQKTLQDLPDGTCQHADGTIFSASECALRNHTTLEELIDEDGPGTNNQPVDQDVDGNVEDVPDPAMPGASKCAQNNGVEDQNGGCDFTQGMRHHINQKLQEKKNKGELPPHRQNDFKQGFKLDANGNCDPLAEGEYECGKEPRTVTLTETFEISCPRGAEFKDGRCEMPGPPPGGLTLAALETSAFSPVLGTTASTTTAFDYAMMGFTFAPPVLKWGVDIKQEVCIFFCFEIFAFRFGYEFDFAAGLRLPVKVSLTDVPSPNVNVEEERTLHASLEPMDFTVGDYKSFCAKHNLARDWWISDCERFAFPDYFESLIPPSLLSPDSRQGSEFVAQSSIFAGLVIRVLSIPVVNYAIDNSMNLPALCTFYKMKGSGLSGPVDFALNMISTQNFLDSLRNSLTNCATFTTPFGYEPDPITQVPRLRSFPFLSGTYTIGADCTKAVVDGNIIELGGKKKPICTGLKLDIYGATLGLAINLTLAAGSDLIDANSNIRGDGTGTPDQALAFHHDRQGVQEPALQEITFDNYDDSTDDAIIELDDFVYHLNQLQVRVGASLEFGGIASFLPNIGDLTIFTLNLQLPGGGIPIPQHPGTGPARFNVPVANYALSVDAGPAANDPMRVDAKTVKVQPGVPATFLVSITNEGSVPDTIDNFVRALSNHPNQTSPFEFRIYENTDFDCGDAGGTHYRGYPYDNVADDCYLADGSLRPDRIEFPAYINEDPIDPGNGDVASRDQDKDGLADEDPPDVWNTIPDVGVLGQQVIADIPAHTPATQQLTLQVYPFWHALTAPGLYPVQIKADSRQARTLKLNSPDPKGYARTGAEDVVFLRIESFFDPKVRVTPGQGEVKPGATLTYTVEGENGGNTADRIAMLRAFADSNTAGGCTLTTLGTLASCLYRATPTIIPTLPVSGWNVTPLEAWFGPQTGLDPLGYEQHSFTITVPPDWAGMQDTLYEFTITGTSSVDTAMPPASNQVIAHHKVVATKESMTRYIQLELNEFIAEIERAAALGVRARGVEPVMIHPVRMMNQRALEQILAGDLSAASKTLAANIRVMQAVDRMVNGADLLDPFGGDWKARSAAILADMAKAQAAAQ